MSAGHVTTAIFETAPLSDRLAARDRRAFEGCDPNAVVFATRTKVDTGSWLRKSRVLACRQGDELVLFAPGKRSFVGKIPLAELGESFYNHVTGEVALAPADGASVRGLRLSPVEGCRLLKEIGVLASRDRARR